MSIGCRERWRLWGEVEKQDREAIAAGYPNADFYKPFLMAFTAYQAHFNNCPECKTWANEFAEGVKDEVSG